MTTKETLSQRLNQLTEKQIKTQIELANEIHVAQSTVSKIESGKREPSLDVLVYLANSFQTTTDFLLGRTENDSPSGLLTAEQSKDFMDSKLPYYYSLMDPTERMMLEAVLFTYVSIKQERLVPSKKDK